MRIGNSAKAPFGKGGFIRCCPIHVLDQLTHPARSSTVIRSGWVAVWLNRGRRTGQPGGWPRLPANPCTRTPSGARPSQRQRRRRRANSRDASQPQGGFDPGASKIEICELPQSGCRDHPDVASPLWQLLARGSTKFSTRNWLIRYHSIAD